MNYQYFFENRIEAGRELAEKISEFNFHDPVVLALPRGGVPVAKEIALKLKAPLDVVVVRKIGSPYNPEYGIGAMSEDFEPLFRPSSEFEDSYYAARVREIVVKEAAELKRRIKYYRGDRALPEMGGRTVILVDDGIATGISAAATAKYIKTLGPDEVIIASPVCPQRNEPLLEKYTDKIICLHRPTIFSGVGEWYYDFGQVSDREVLDSL